MSEILLAILIGIIIAAGIGTAFGITLLILEWLTGE